MLASWEFSEKSEGRQVPALTIRKHFGPAKAGHYCCCCCCAVLVFAGGGGAIAHNGQPMTTSFFVRCSFSRRFAISVRNCSSLSATRLPRSMNMLATERLPDPCQLRGSGMFLFDGELSMNPMM